MEAVMKREFLEQQGLDKEKIEMIMAEHGKSFKGDKEKGERVASLEAQVADLTNQLSERDKQLAELESLEPEKMKETIAKLKLDNENSAKELEGKYNEKIMDMALNNKLAQSGVKNSKALMALLDTSSISYEGDKIVGLDEQLRKLKESDAYLFDQPPAGDTGGGGNPSNVKAGKKGLDEDVKSAIWGGRVPKK